MDLIPEGTKVQVSATAHGTSRKAILADSEDAWTSPVVPAYVALSFPEPINATKIALTFQGGFAATAIGISFGDEGNAGKIYPEDKNRRQVFDLPTVKEFSSIRLDLEGTSDNQGRITLYRLELLP